MDDTVIITTTDGVVTLTHKTLFMNKSGQSSTKLYTFGNVGYIFKESPPTFHTIPRQLPNCYMRYNTLDNHLIMEHVGNRINCLRLQPQPIITFIKSYLIDGFCRKYVAMIDMKIENLVMVGQTITIIDHESIFSLDDDTHDYLKRTPVASYSFRKGLVGCTMQVYIEIALFAFMLIIIVLAGKTQHWANVRLFEHTVPADWKSSQGTRTITDYQISSFTKKLCVKDSERIVLQRAMVAIQQTNINDLVTNLIQFVRIQH